MLLAITLLLAAPQDGGLAWLAGEWCTDAAAGPQTCESWKADADGAMIGESRTLRADGRGSSEAMRIRRVDGKRIFTASPDGAPPTDFTLVASTESGATFENRGHDYPQRVRYWREGDLLKAEIAMADGSKPVSWTFRRARD